MGAVADRGGLLLEAERPILGGCYGGHRATHVATGAELGGDGGDQALLLTDLAQVLLEPRCVLEMAGDRDRLDLVHREHHRAGAAVAPQLEAAGCDRLEGDAAPAELTGDESGSAARP